MKMILISFIARKRQKYDYRNDQDDLNYADMDSFFDFHVKYSYII